MTAKAAAVAETIRALGLLEPRDRVLVAFSGGADSMALALVLAQLGYDLVLGHVDHRLRPTSVLDAEHCSDVAGRLGFPFELRRVVVDPPTQAEARRIRYLALEDMARTSAASKIATGHTLDDDVETVVLRLGRGGFGLGIPPKRGMVVRPIIGLRRHETEALCTDAGVEFVRDPSNEDLRYARVAIRAALASASEKHIGELAATSRRSAALAEVVRAEAAALWERSVHADAAPQLLIDRRSLGSAPRRVARQLIWTALARLGVDANGRLVENILDKVVTRTGAGLDLGKRLSVWSEADLVVIGERPSNVCLPEFPLTVGETESREWGMSFRVDEVGPREEPDASGWEALLDAKAASGVASAELWIRQWRPGDRFHPLGAPGGKKLQDFFVDSKVPRHRRSAVPLLIVSGRIAWVVGHRIDERFKVTSRSQQALRVRATPLSIKA